MKNFFKTVGHGIGVAWEFLCCIFPFIVFVAIVVGIIFGVTSCSKYEMANSNTWEETKQVIEYDAEIVDMTFSGSDSGVTFYIWYENSLGEETKTRIEDEQFIDFAEATKYHGTIIVKAEVGTWYEKTVEKNAVISIKEVKPLGLDTE